MYRLILLFILIFFSCVDFNNKEIIIPSVKIKDGGILKKSRSSDPVKYFNKTGKKKDGIVKLDNYIRLKQTANRYLKVSGNVDFKNRQFLKDHYQSVIFEIKYFIDNVEYSDFYTIPFVNNRFDGYVYFKSKGINKVFAYCFYDYLTNHGNIDNGSNDTLAMLGFIVDAAEKVPDDLIYLLPSENVDCGNKIIIDTAKKITKDCKTDIEKAKRIFEYIVFGYNKNIFSFKQYEENYKVYSGNNYYNAFIASQVLINKNGICNDFAELYAAMMRALGFKIKKISGYYDISKSTGHMWNLLDLNGDEKTWLKVDASWACIDKKNYKRWAQIYPEFNDDYFENSFKPFCHSSFIYERKIEY